MLLWFVAALMEFLSTPSARRATCRARGSRDPTLNFYPRPLRGGRRSRSPVWSTLRNFYPRPLRGGRRPHRRPGTSTRRFLSTPSARRATPAAVKSNDNVRFLSTPSARRATQAALDMGKATTFLSTPSARRATQRRRAARRARQISIHALCEEGDIPAPYYERMRAEFLSTPSARRATLLQTPFIQNNFNFYPRPPRGGRHPPMKNQGEYIYFYPRPPRGGRHIQQWMRNAARIFLSTPSARRATKAASQIAKLMQFLSTPSARRATNRAEPYARHKNISIHALREEGDRPL